MKVIKLGKSEILMKISNEEVSESYGLMSPNIWYLYEIGVPKSSSYINRNGVSLYGKLYSSEVIDSFGEKLEKENKSCVEESSFDSTMGKYIEVSNN